ncbi:glycoside hydrolase family 127 protein [Ruania halotolerans]|uniref:glycoside hydrolase family 127 protein n=1 Tax=Ruania halotolerans TaxID=2897773 RepID=UPI001E486EDB|nr:beta-L-arabinofuranosidase domain-containing protein [Ruania halotolerans]UFU06974.1 glycoside hydrolase family 127 protein [Ruania halotolerans]
MTETLTSSGVRARPVAPAGHRRGVGIGELLLDGGFWGSLQQTNAHATLTHCLDWMERLGWLANFDHVAAGTTGGHRPGWQFSDSEVYKLLEAMAWEFGRTADPDSTEWSHLVRRIAAAQDDDGYLNTCYGHAGQAPRYSDLSTGHELYCTGHLLQAAVARVRTHGVDELVEVARRAADQVCREFGPDGRDGICGHPEIELGLVELGRALGEPRYTEQARLFIERRGRGTLAPIALLSPAYFQDDVPVREVAVWRGHAVRALYLAAGAVDVAVDTDDHDLRTAVERQWTRTVERRTYLTGGMGSRHQDEGFGDDWELPPDRAYCETCAGIASVMVSWRLLLASDDVRYADLIERTFYNVVATSPRADGRAFFYANPLQQREQGAPMQPDAVNPRAEGGARAPWFDVSCCPTNVARTLASWHTYAAFVDDSEGPAGPADGVPTVTLAQYASGDLRVAVGTGELALRVETTYPESGIVRIRVLEVPERPVALRLRVPHWAEGATLAASSVSSPGTEQPSNIMHPARTAHSVAPGWVEVPGERAAGDVVVLELPVTPRLTWPDPRVDAARGTVAVERGPIVLCLESVDLPAGIALEHVRIDTAAELRPYADGALVTARTVELPDGGTGVPPFSSGAAGACTGHDLPDGGAQNPIEVPLVPYHRWAERGPSTMRVFVPTD